MSPFQHGEVFVTDDGAETDLDIGHYERFTDENSSADSNVTSGKVYNSVITKERRGDYLGGTVQVIPHITNEIMDKIFSVGKNSGADIVITEIGGTVGDIESQPFLEAIRQMKWKVGEHNCMYLHVSFVPYLRKVGEIKTKPTQHSVKELRALGIQPDVLVCRSEVPLERDIKEKLSLFCNVDTECVIHNPDCSSIYEVPLVLQKEKLDEVVLKKLNLPLGESRMEDWKNLVERQYNLDGDVKIAIVGKYIELHDAYLSIVESLHHAAIYNGQKISIKWISAVDLEDKDASIDDYLGDVQGIIVPGGFGERGIEGKISAARYAREHKVPYLGICLGMQIAVVEFARNVLGLKDANSTELSPSTKNPVIDFMPEQKNIEKLGGTMRLGRYACELVEGSIAKEAYGCTTISERHRHRYEFNNDYREMIENAGLRVAGINPESDLVEIVELKDHPWFVGVQFHPEFKSRPDRPHPLFRELFAAASKIER